MLRILFPETHSDIKIENEPLPSVHSNVNLTGS